MYTMEIEKLEHGLFTRDGKEYSFASISGRDAEGRYARASCYSPHAEALIASIERSLQPGMDLKSARIMIELDGEWTSRKKEGYPRPLRYYKFGKFEILTGPSVVLQRAIKDGTVALRNAGASLNSGDVNAAYKALESFVAVLTSQPAPSVDHDDIFDPALVADGMDEVEAGENPEMEAVARLVAYDARHAPAGRQDATITVFGGEALKEPEASEKTPVETIAEEDIPFSNDEAKTETLKGDSVGTDEAPVDQSEAVAETPAETPARRVGGGFSVRRPPALSATARAVAASEPSGSKSTATTKPDSSSEADNTAVEPPATPNRPVNRPRLGMGLGRRG